MTKWLAWLIIKTVKKATHKRKEENNMKKYEVFVAGTVIGTYDNKEDAEKRLFEAKHSFLAMVHPTDAFWIKEKAC